MKFRNFSEQLKERLAFTRMGRMGADPMCPSCGLVRDSYNLNCQDCILQLMGKYESSRMSTILEYDFYLDEKFESKIVQRFREGLIDELRKVYSKHHRLEELFNNINTTEPNND